MSKKDGGNTFDGQDNDVRHTMVSTVVTGVWAKNNSKWIKIYGLLV